MPGWLLNSPHDRADEMVLDFVRQFSEAGSPEQCLRSACELLSRFLGAEAVVLFQLAPDQEHLEAVVSSAPEWELLGELALDSLPEWRTALAETRPRWLDRIAFSGAGTLLEAQRALLLPIHCQRQSCGCLIAASNGSGVEPGGEELEAGRMLAQLLAPLLQARRLDSRLQAFERYRLMWEQLEDDLRQRGLSSATLNHLLELLIQGAGAQLAAVFERHDTGLTRVAAAGATHLLPLRLALEHNGTTPWGRALAEGGPVEGVAADLFPQGTGLAPGADNSALTAIPMGTREAPLGVLLIGGGACLGRNGFATEWSGLAALAGATLLCERTHRLEREQRARWQALLHGTHEPVLLLDSCGRI